MRTPRLLAAAALVAVPLAGCASYGPDRDPYEGYYERQYRAGDYRPYALDRGDRIYRGTDGRYYCRRRDGTMGLVVGAGIGALLGNIIAPRGSNTLGTIIGAAGGAGIGYAIDRGEVRCH